MSHSWGYEHTSFIGNSDLSGDITIKTNGGESLDISGNDLKLFMLDYFRGEMIRNIEDLNDDQLEKLLTTPGRN